jgi:hypothetical protein
MVAWWEGVQAHNREGGQACGGTTEWQGELMAARWGGRLSSWRHSRRQLGEARRPQEEQGGGDLRFCWVHPVWICDGAHRCDT